MGEEIILEDYYDQFRLIDPGKIKISNLSDLTFKSDTPDDSIYVSVLHRSDLLLKQNVINMQRELELPAMFSLLNHGFNIPPFVYANSLTEMFQHLDSKKKYVLKSFGSARTLGQMLISKNDIFSIKEFLISKSCTAETFNRNFNIDTSTARNEAEESFLFDRIDNGNVYISEFVEFESEYRVLYFQGDSGDPVIEMRKGYGTASGEERTHEIVSLEESRLTAEIIRELKEFGDLHPSPMLSFDVYVTESPLGWGLFEYCSQFGIVYPDYYDIIGAKMTNAMLSAIEQLPKNRKHHGGRY